MRISRRQPKPCQSQRSLSTGSKPRRIKPSTCRPHRRKSPRRELTGADLAGANLKKATLYRTIFGNTNLACAKGLDSCKHIGPSIVDHSTLSISGPLPLAFLRGCGLPENYITYLPSLLNQPIQFYSCFISYSTQDQTFADRLYADLQNKGVRC